MTVTPRPPGNRAGRADRTVPSDGAPARSRGTADGPDPASRGARAGLTAAASITADVAGDRTRIRWTQAWPIVLRPTGPRRVHLVHGAGGPLGGDDLSLAVRLDAGASLAVRSAGATLVQPGRAAGPARWDTTIDVGRGAALDWAPEPTVVTDRAAFAARMHVAVAEGARASVREIVVLGRHGGPGGAYRGRLNVTVAGRPVLAHTTLLDRTDDGLAGPGGLAGARAVGSLLVVGGDARPAAVPAEPAGTGEDPGVRWAWTPLAAGGALLQAVGEPAAVIALLTRQAPPA